MVCTLQPCISCRQINISRLSLPLIVMQRDSNGKPMIILTDIMISAGCRWQHQATSYPAQAEIVDSQWLRQDLSRFIQFDAQQAILNLFNTSV